MEYENLNLSELAAAAAQLNPEAHRGMSREALISIIEGEDVTLAQRSINKKRLNIMQYMNTNWEQVACLVNCPAKSRSPVACFSCCDVQVAACILQNPHIDSE